MKRSFLVTVLLTMFGISFAQRKVIVPEGFATLNEIIRKDTVAGGARKDPNTVYVLRRGGVYILGGTILTSGFNLTLEAEEGNGPRPYVVMGFIEGATQVEECFEVRGNLTMRSIHVTALNEVNTFIARVVSASSPNLRLSFYDCLIDGSGQTFIRINSSGSKVYMLNTTVSRMGRPSNPDNGRVIDDRGNQIDSLVIENNTWYNITSRIVRDGGGEINYAKLNQNTFVNVGQRLAAIGQVNKFIFTNNLAVNPRFLGNSATSDIVALEFTPIGSNPVADIRSNNIYYDPEVLAAWQAIRDAGISRLEPPLTVAANSSLIINRINEPLTFQSRPVPPTEFILESELNNSSSIPDWDWTGAAIGKPWELTDGYHNFSYPASTNSFTSSLTGEPLGDLRWFPNFDVAWTVRDLIGQAILLINRELNNPVIGGNPAFLATLQSAIASAQSTSNNSSSSGAQLAAARNSLQSAMNDFRGSLIITASESEQTTFSVFPNPTINQVTVQCAEGTFKADLMTLEGKLVQSQRSNGQEVSFTVADLPVGVYLIHVITSQGVSLKKIIKQ